MTYIAAILLNSFLAGYNFAAFRDKGSYLTLMFLIMHTLIAIALLWNL